MKIGENLAEKWSIFQIFMLFFQKKWALMIIAGGVFGPAAYFTGKGFEAIYFELGSLSSALIIGVVWAISMPMVFYINEKIVLGK